MSLAIAIAILKGQEKQAFTGAFSFAKCDCTYLGYLGQGPMCVKGKYSNSSLLQNMLLLL
jgi:hypothetical protein